MSALSALYGRVASARRAWFSRRPHTVRRLPHAVVSVGNLVVGGSIVPAGGHNILEPAAYGKAIVFGPHMENFSEITETFLANDAAVRVQSEGELEEALLSLMGDPVRRARLGAAARALVVANRGAKDKTLAAIADVLPAIEPRSAVVRPFRVVH